MAWSNVYSNLLTALSGQSSTVISAAMSAVGSALHTTGAQVTTQLNALASLCNNPPAYVASANNYINNIETEVATNYAQALPLLEKLRPVGGTMPDVLVVADTISAIEKIV